MATSLARSILFFAALGVACACASSSVDEGAACESAALAFPGGGNDGYCASNPTPDCAHGTPLAPKQLVLTFDDGPGSQTAAFSSWLSSQGIPATFFVLGSYATSQTATLAEEAADGHLIGNHTWDHADLTTLSSAQITSELGQTDAVIAPYVANGRWLFRAPYGSWSANDYNVLQASPMNKYVGPVRWDIGGYMSATYAADWDCWQNQSGYGVLTSKQCGDRYLRQIADYGRGIVLMHDQDYGDVNNHDPTSGEGNTIDMVKYMVPILKSQGYSFVRLDQVPDIAAAWPKSDAGADAGGDAAKDSGGGGDGAVEAGTTCGFDPTWAQGNANTWWIEYSIGGNVSSASFEIVGGATIPLTFQYEKWLAGPSQAVPSGTTVIVHATNASNQKAATKPFPYLVTTNPVTDCGAPVDGGATDSGAADSGQADSGVVDACSAALDPTWSQGSGANDWWVEYAISASGATITSASLEVVSGPTVPLSFQWNKWVGPTAAPIGAGTSVIVHAADNQGHVAQTNAFGYLRVTAPKTATCF